MIVPLEGPVPRQRGRAFGVPRESFWALARGRYTIARMTLRVTAAGVAATIGLAVGAAPAHATDYFATTDNTATTQDCLTEATACALGKAGAIPPAVPLADQAVGVHTLTLLPGTYDTTDFDAGAPIAAGGRFDVERGLTVQGKPGAPAPTIDVTATSPSFPGIKMDNGGILRHLKVIRNSAGYAATASGFGAQTGVAGAVATVDRVQIEVNTPALATNGGGLGLGDFSVLSNSFIDQRGGVEDTVQAVDVRLEGEPNPNPRIFGATLRSATGAALFVSGAPTGMSATVQVRNTVLSGHVDIDAQAPGSPVSPLTVEMHHSAWRNAPPTTIATGPTIIDAKTAAIGGDLKLDGGGKPLEGSPLIDAGAAFAELGSLDLDGNARLQGTAPDVGAFEAGGTTPPPSGGDTPGAGTPGGSNPAPISIPAPPVDKVGPVATVTTPKTIKRAKLTKGKGLSFSVKLDEPVVTGKLELLEITKAKGKRPAKEKVLATATRTGTGTTLVFTLKAKTSKVGTKGKRKLTLRFTLVDAAGNKTLVERPVTLS